MSRKDKMQRMTLSEQQEMLGDELSFAGAEAYKLLRTNIAMSVAGVDCPILGVTSALPGEAKSTTAINLAYAMVQDGKRVLLIESDLRLPAIAKRLGLQAQPGLTNLLVGMCSGTEALQHCSLHRNLYIIAAGSSTPNPSELLGSERMEIALKTYAKSFDYIILDLPPVTSVSDPLVISKNCTGMILAVRRGYCRKRVLREALRQLELVHAKVLGFVFTHAEVNRKAYKKYGYGYGYGAASGSGKQKKAANGTK